VCGGDAGKWSSGQYWTSLNQKPSDALVLEGGGEGEIIPYETGFMKGKEYTSLLSFCSEGGEI
jgi:hypothetical protein